MAYLKAMRSLALAACLAIGCARAEPRVTGPSVGARPAFDAARLRTGRFVYRTTLDGTDAGTATISVTRIDARTYRFANEVQGKFRQTWESTATSALEPLTATLGLGPSDDKARTMRLSYEGRSVRGTATKLADDPRTGEVSADVPSDVVDQRVDWAAVMSAPLAPGGALAFTVFDPWTGLSPLSAWIGEPEQVRVPAGTFSVLRVVYRIEKKERGLEQYEVWVTQSEPRFLVREDFPNGARTELVQIAE
jgi:hypothetical protein